MSGLIVLVAILVAQTNAGITRTETSRQPRPLHTHQPAKMAVGQPTESVTATNLGEASVITSSFGTQTTLIPGNKSVTFATYFQNIGVEDPPVVPFVSIYADRGLLLEDL